MCSGEQVSTVHEWSGQLRERANQQVAKKIGLESGRFMNNFEYFGV